ncbi:AMP-dependent synthetase, partial [Mycobacterium tuberculosis]
TSAFAMGVERDDTQLCVAPMYHVAGMLTGVNVPVLCGDTAVLLHRFEPRATLQAIDRYRITAWYSIAPMNAACMQQPDITRFDLSSLSKNTVTSFGIAFTEALALQWKSFAPNAHAREAAYGLSETHSCDTYMPTNAIR